MEEWKISNPKFQSDELNDKLVVSPWSGHRYFIYDYLKYIKPNTIVELGTHYGCSFFAMCQAIKDNNLNTKIYAVDTWKGDEQAGFYGDEVWNVVHQTKDIFFEKQNAELVRMLFDEAASKFEDGKFDLIHIDGLHTYEAVSHDFETWIPKLKENGVILFHDVHSKLKYGTNKFWKEIKVKYPYYFEFFHSWGLGILFPKGNKIYEKLLKNNFQDKLLIYQYKALYEYECIKTTDLTAMADDRYAAINQQSKMIDERDATIKSQTKLIDDKDNAIKSQTELINERDATIESQTKLINERDATIESQTKLIDDKDDAIRSQTELINERDTTIKNQTQMINERDATIQEQDRLINQKNAIIKNYTDEEAHWKHLGKRVMVRK